MAKDNQSDFEPISEEELIELVLEEQKKALEKERQERLMGVKPTKKKMRQSTRLVAWIMAGMLMFSTFAVIFEIYSIPAIEFLKTSASLSGQDDIKAYKKAVVEVKTNSGKGTGFTISSDGYIITNEHVIEDALTVTITFPDDGIFKGEVVKSFPDIDLAILKVEGEDLPYLELADSYEPTKSSM